MKRTHYIFISLFLLVISCKQKMLLPHEYVQWMSNESNGVKVKKKIGDFEFSLQYKTPEYVILQQYKSDTIKSETVNKEKKELDGMQYYTFQVKSEDGKDILQTGISDESEYSSRLEYFLSDAQDDMSLVENGDTIPCTLYHFERNYNLGPLSTIVLGFEKTKTFSSADKTFIYNDQVLGTGPVQLTIQEKDIQQIPPIRYVQN
jgi:hypothetical protein